MWPFNSLVTGCTGVDCTVTLLWGPSRKDCYDLESRPKISNDMEKHSRE